MANSINQNLLSQLKHLNEDRFYRPSATLKQHLEALRPDKLRADIQGFFKERLEKESMSRPERLIERLSAVVPTSALEKVEEVYEQAQIERAQAEHYLDMTTPKGIECRERASALLDSAILVLDNVIRAFGIADFFRAADSDLHADFKSQKIMMLFSLFSMLMTMLMPIVGLQAASMGIGSFFLVLFVLSFIWPYIKPMPQNLPANAENWTQQIKQGGFVGQGRKEAFDGIANILKTGRHPILVGPSRVGKSLTAKGFAQAVARGDYPELKGKVVFRINTADLLDQKPSFLGGGNNILQQISVAMGRYRKNIILVLDEVHMACKNNSTISDMLKTFLEEGGEFAHVIGITTDEEYAHVAGNNAFSLRFERVNIENTNEDETLRILSDAVLKSAQRPLLEEGILSTIYEKTNDAQAPQPTTALKLLKKCLNQTSRSQQSTKEKEIIHIGNQIARLKSQCSAYRSMTRLEQAKMAELQQKLARLEEERRNEQRQLDQLFQAKERLEKMTTLLYHTVIQTARKPTVRQASRLQLTRLLVDVMKASFKEKAQSLGIRVIVDRPLVDQFTRSPAPISLREEVTASFGLVED
jgi:ATP-dependent Clp protease ATP-binding subunit ClpA